MPDDLFTKQSQDSKPLHRNTLPVAECDVHDATVGGKACKAIDVPILGCASIWLRVQREAEAWIAPGGKLIADPIARNRRINQAYAQLWQTDRRFQWAGLAAFASKQVGCGLLHAAENVRKSQEEIDINNQRPGINSTDMATANSVPAAISISSAYMYQQLALGNTALFLDIYPLHRFYMLRGFEHLKHCLNERILIANQVIWPIDKSKLAFGKPFQAITDAFAFVEKGQIEDSVKRFALHEQVNILQSAIYNDVAMKRALDANQFSWALDFPTGVAADIALTLSAECRVKSGRFTVTFPKTKTAKLYDKEQRMTFVYSAATRFAALLNGAEKSSIEASISEIARTGGRQ